MSCKLITSRELSEGEIDSYYKKARSRSALLSYYIYRKISFRISLFLYRTPVSPNQITIFSLLCSIFAAIFVTYGSYPHLVVACFLIQLSYITDLIDGEVARFKGLESTFGAWLDSIVGLLNTLVLYFGFAFGYFFKTNDWRAFLLLSLVIATRFFLNYIKFSIKRLFDLKGEQTASVLIKKISDFTAVSPRHITYSDDIKMLLLTLGVLFNQLMPALLVFVFIHSCLILFVFVGSLRFRTFTPEK